MGRGRESFVEKWFMSVFSWIDDIGILTSVFRISLSVICGGILGVERGKENQAAGMRTYMLVCLGATLVMLTGEYMFTEYNTGDPARLGAQVISGIGFLGAGSIIVEGKTRVKGLTTAAGLWAAACIGLAIGIGYYAGGIISTVAVYLVISKFRSISDHFTHNDMWMRIYVEFKEIKDLQEIYTAATSFGLQVGDVMMNNPQNSGIYNAILSLKLPDDRSNAQVIYFLKKIQGVFTVKQIV